MEEKLNYTVNSRIWIRTEQGEFLGEGRVVLLQKIDKCGSISKAALEMNMSYKKAWDLVNSMNSRPGNPLVTRKIGGKGGGGSELTKAGKQAVKLFTQLKEENHQFLDAKLNEMSFDQ